MKLKKKCIFDYFNEQISSLLAQKKLGTARNYKCTLNSLSNFLGGKNLPFSAFNEELVLKYDAWLQKDYKLSRNSQSFYMRNLRAVYNKAVEQHIAKQTHPFRNVYTGIDKTRKRAVDEQVIVQLQQLDLAPSSRLAMSRDAFIFSYATRGMAFVDIAYLLKSNIHNDTIIYSRHKTGQTLQIYIEPCIRNIIEHYLELYPNSPRLFPFVTSSDPIRAYKQYQAALGYHNRLLKKLGKCISPKVVLTSYTPRHAWATAARNHNIPIAVISEGMGHTSEKTTLIYLASLETSVIDQANRTVLEALNK